MAQVDFMNVNKIDIIFIGIMAYSKATIFDLTYRYVAR
jgi:hypothetical protein